MRTAREARDSKNGGTRVAGALPNLLAKAKRGPRNEAQGSTEPERKLLGAILQDAIECWQACAVVAPVWRVSGYSQLGKRQKNYYEADFWFFEEYDNAPYFSFQKICDHLGLEPDFIRRRLLDWRGTRLNEQNSLSVIPARSALSDARGIPEKEPVPASLARSCPRSFDSARDARFAQDDRNKRLSPSVILSRRASEES